MFITILWHELKEEIGVWAGVIVQVLRLPALHTANQDFI